MSFCYFVLFSHPQDPTLRLAPAQAAALRSCLAALPGLRKAHFYTPAEARDRFTDDGAPPVFGLQLYFDTLQALGSAVCSGGAFHSLVQQGGLSSLDAAKAEQQAMLLRPYDVPEPKPASATATSFLVWYPGPADDLQAWLGAYLRGHAPLLRQFPGLRELEILSRVDWIDQLPWPRVQHMQRNRVMFDSPEALTEALFSPVREALRDDSATAPRYSGGNRHYPMLTEVVAGPASATAR